VASKEQPRAGTLEDTNYSDLFLFTLVAVFYPTQAA